MIEMSTGRERPRCMWAFHEGDLVIADAGEVLAVSVVAPIGKPGILDASQARQLRAFLSEWILRQP